MTNKSPINQEWVLKYVGKLLTYSEGLSKHSPMRRSAETRAEAIMDMLKAWQERA